MLNSITDRRAQYLGMAEAQWECGTCQSLHGEGNSFGMHPESSRTAIYRLSLSGFSRKSSLRNSLQIVRERASSECEQPRRQTKGEGERTLLHWIHLIECPSFSSILRDAYEAQPIEN